MAVYFILNRRAVALKIGKADNVEKRLAAIQTHCPDQLELLGSIRGDQEEERTLHLEFREHRIRGEWFRASSEALARVAEILGGATFGLSGLEEMPADAPELSWPQDASVPLDDGLLEMRGREGGPLWSGVAEAAYRRGCQQAAARLLSLIRGCASLQDAIFLVTSAEDVLGELRRSERPLPFYLDELERSLTAQPNSRRQS